MILCKKKFLIIYLNLKLKFTQIDLYTSKLYFNKFLTLIGSLKLNLNIIVIFKSYETCYFLAWLEKILKIKKIVAKIVFQILCLK